MTKVDKYVIIIYNCSFWRQKMKGGIFMARKEDERTLKMKENFIELHDNGNSIAEIAKIYGLDKTTVYHCLQEIAEKSGRTRESLLVAPHSTHLTYERQFEPVAEVDLTSFNENFKSTLKSFDSVCESVNKTIEEQEQLLNDFKEGEN